MEAGDTGSGTTFRGRPFPVGLAPGAVAFVGSWVVTWAIARLTGAAAVFLVLVAGAVVGIGAVLAGGWRLRGVDVVGVTTTSIATAGDTFDVVVRHSDRSGARSPVVARINVTGRDGATRAVARTTLDPSGVTTAAALVDRAGIVDRVTVELDTAGAGGLVWWRRRTVKPLTPLHVAPRPSGPVLPVDEATDARDGSARAPRGPLHGEVDGVRPWRPGESDQAIHWPSTLRADELVAHDRVTSGEVRWTVPLDSDPARLRHTLDSGLRTGREVVVVATTDPTDDQPSGTPATHTVRSHDDAARWAAIAADRRTSEAPTPPPWWRRDLRLHRDLEVATDVPARVRWAIAAATSMSVWMLLGALDAPTSSFAVTGIAVAVVAAVTLRYRRGRRPLLAAVVAGGLALGALVKIAVDTAGIGGLLEALRGPLPDLLIVLVVLHGIEVADRRTARVHLAIGATVVAYAAGLRIDPHVGWWLLGWSVVAIAATVGLGRAPSPDRSTPQTPPRRAAPIGTTPTGTMGAAGWILAAAATTLAAGALVPIPDGPARLGLPALAASEAAVDTPGALVGPDGTTAPSGGTGDRRGALGEVGGYPGFSDALDTSVRGDLGDEVVMRVRAPAPAFWRGQTFTEFDGRTWRVAELDAPRLEGPEIVIEPTLGDLPAPGWTTESFVQTFHAERDLPNVVFAAARPSTVVFDGAVFPRGDGSIRADRSLSAGTVYTVVSERVVVTADALRAQGDLGERFGAVTRPGAERILAPLLTLPASTSKRTIELADRLRVEGSTYDTILAYEAWLAANTVYDLDAPVPPAGADAVDDHLFVSRRGFCEQIASSLVVMLRSQGVPARLATGYLPGDRDRVSGVWQVRASDAHAWAEVWFPETGWHAFDPTADVPLSGETTRSTIGGDAATALLGLLLARPVELGLAAAAVLAAGGVARAARRARRRRERGRWGRLHDRLAALVDLDADPAATAPGIAAALSAHDDPRIGELAHGIATALDRSAFDPSWEPSDADADAVERALDELERRLRARATPARAGLVSASS